MLNKHELHKLVKDSIGKSLSDELLDGLYSTLTTFDINTKECILHFISQTVHESGRYYYKHNK